MPSMCLSEWRVSLWTFISPFQVNLMGHFKQVIVIGLLGGGLPPWLFGCHQGHL